LPLFIWINDMLISEMDGQGVKQSLELGCAFLLSAAIGLEREIRHKSAGLRTYSVVGTAAALFMLISKYGFMNVLAQDLVIVDPSRDAAQIVTSIGFVGAGLIFVREDPFGARCVSFPARRCPPNRSKVQSMIGLGKEEEAARVPKEKMTADIDRWLPGFWRERMFCVQPGSAGGKQI
jgi:hypothetical protein